MRLLQTRAVATKSASRGEAEPGKDELHHVEDCTQFVPERASGTKVLIIDHYDSFTYNLVQLCLQLGAHVTVTRSDHPIDALLAKEASHWILSPGPGRPEDAGLRPALWRHALQGQTPPVLGVCLGHQGLCAAMGAKVVTAQQIMHGKRSAITHDGTGVFTGIAPRFSVVRYHSLVVAIHTLPPQLRACAFTEPTQDAGPELMGVAHTKLPLFGLQFHPESIGSEQGHALLSNFLAI